MLIAESGLPSPSPLPAVPAHSWSSEVTRSERSSTGRGNDAVSISDAEVKEFLLDLRDDISAVHTTAEAAARAASLAADKVQSADQHVQPNSMIRRQQEALESLREEVTIMREAMQAHEQSVATATLDNPVFTQRRDDSPVQSPEAQPEEQLADTSHCTEHQQHRRQSEGRSKMRPTLSGAHQQRDGWKEGYDIVREKTYWYNVRTKETRWQPDRPQESTEREDRTDKGGKQLVTTQTGERNRVKRDAFDLKPDVTSTAFSPYAFGTT